MTLRQIADFNAEFEDDGVWDGDEPVILGGRNVADTVAGFLRGFGCEVSVPDHTPPYGWRFGARGRDARVWIQVTDLGDNYVLATQDRRSFFQRLFKPAIQEHAELLSRLHGALAGDGRFSNIKWWDRYDMRGVSAETPVSAEGR